MGQLWPIFFLLSKHTTAFFLPVSTTSFIEINMDKSSIQNKTINGPNPPAYNGHDEDTQTPPNYGENQRVLAPIASPRPRSFPVVMNAYARWTHWKSLILCGADRNERLGLVEMYMGYNTSKPLGTRPGIILHDGMSTKNPVLAAAGDKVHLVSPLDAHSDIILPPLDGSGESSSRQIDTEVMRGGTSAAGDGSITFSFSIEVGEKQRRERHEWRKFNSGGNVDDSKKRGFRLVRLFQQEGASCASSMPDCHGETVALLTLYRLRDTATHALSLELTVGGRSGVLGERWTLMIFITALQLYALRWQGRTNRVSAGIEEGCH